MFGSIPIPQQRRGIWRDSVTLVKDSPILRYSTLSLGYRFTSISNLPSTIYKRVEVNPINLRSFYNGKSVPLPPSNQTKYVLCGNSVSLESQQNSNLIVSSERSIQQINFNPTHNINLLNDSFPTLNASDARSIVRSINYSAPSGYLLLKALPSIPVTQTTSVTMKSDFKLPKAHTLISSWRPNQRVIQEVILELSLR